MLSVVWHGAWHTTRELPDRYPEDGDDESMELEGVDAYVDGEQVTSLGAPANGEV
jgi:hypothetical protein